MKFVKADSKLPPVEFITDVKHWRETDLCGVTAIAAITGASVEYITHVMMRARGSERPIVGVRVGEVMNTLGILGFRADLFDVTPPSRRRLTMQRFWLNRGDEQPACIAYTKTHFVALDCFGAIDTCTRGQLDTFVDHPYSNYSIQGYIEVRKLNP